jgi:hypothetical protein
MVGTIANWSGLETTAGASWLVDRAADLGFTGIWFSPLTAATSVEKTAHGHVQTGSLYSAKNHFKFDKDFSTGEDEYDRDHMRHFCDYAASRGIRVYADLVFNHVSSDHKLVAQENSEIGLIRHNIDQYNHKKQAEYLQAAAKDPDAPKPVFASIDPLYENGVLVGMTHGAADAERQKFYFKFMRNHDFTMTICGPDEDPWSDVAQINYDSPEAMRFFVTGDEKHQGYFKTFIDWNIDNGVRGFRCDVAYLVPPHAWQELITHARTRQPDMVFMAETLGGPADKIERLGQARIDDGRGGTRPAFDLGMLGIYWWNFRDRQLPDEEVPRMQKAAHFGGAGSPDTHDTATTLARALRQIFNNSTTKRTDVAVARASIRDYAVSVLACPSSYMQMGFEYCNEKQNHVFRGQVTPDDWKNLSQREGTPLDLTQEIKIIHDLKKNLQVENCRVNFKECTTVQDGTIIKLHCEYIDVDTGAKTAETIMLLNRKPEHGAVKITDPAILSLEDTLDKKGARNHMISDIAVFHTPYDQIARKSAPRPPQQHRPT